MKYIYDLIGYIISIKENRQMSRFKSQSETIISYVHLT